MGKIRRLPPELANQIAAGEVVERPASVVKELVENAIDAGATRLSITVEQGGKRLIRIEDDGEGMTPEDAQLALERHATSKIRGPEDLAAIRTLGFRGEALPSIASVSRLVLRTRARGADAGTEVRVEGGATVSVRDVAAPEGTMVEVGSLFFNLPARRKFLKSDAAESAQISRVVTQLALCYPEVGFSLTSAGRKVLQWPPARDFAERFYQVYGERPDLIEVRKEAGGVRLFGCVAALAEQGPVRGPQHVFVNRRYVKDRTIAHALMEAYSAATIKERSPEVHLFVELPADRVDVNVHPTKAEVRFLEQSLIHEVIRRGVGDALGTGPAPPLQLGPLQTGPPEPVPRSIPGVFAGAFQAPRTEGAWPGTQGGRMGAAIEPEPAAGGGDEFSDLAPLVPLGQFRDTFIIAIDSEGIVIVDQHVAHERVLFEQVMERLKAGRTASQRLLQPLVIELAPGRSEALDTRRGELERFGFEIEAFGGGSVKVSGMPAILDVASGTAALRDLAEDFDGLARGAPVDEALRRIAATTACHAAVKANAPLSPEKMRHILEELRRTSYSTVCPHGRPVALRLTRREIEKNFQRL
jgi:DNA mismatch repair protein MutL